MDTDEFVTRRRDLSTRLVELLVAMFYDLGSWRDTDLEVFLEQAEPAVAAGQEMLGQLTAAYIADQAAAVFDTTVPVPALRPEQVTNLRTGADARDVYARPFVELRTALARGRSLDEAVHLGSVRLGQIAEADLQQTYAHASDAAMRQLPTQMRPRYWRRVLQGPENCAMCVVASTQRYHLETLNPIHPGCDCTVDPIWSRNDPGQVIDEERLAQVHAAVKEMTGRSDAGARAPDYRKLMTDITDRHSELGDMLHRRGDHFTTGRELT